MRESPVIYVRGETGQNFLSDLIPSSRAGTIPALISITSNHSQINIHSNKENLFEKVPKKGRVF
jgi:hypothetical protein